MSNERKPKSTVNTPFLNNLYIGHTNKTNPDFRDELTLVGEFDQLHLIIQTYRVYNNGLVDVGPEHFVLPEELQDCKRFRLDIEEVKILIKKLQEFVDKHEEFHDGNFVVGKNESLIEQQERKQEIDIPAPGPLSEDYFRQLMDTTIFMSEPQRQYYLHPELAAESEREWEELMKIFNGKPNPKINKVVEKIEKIKKN